jgi:hypothetical protein
MSQDYITHPDRLQQQQQQQPAFYSQASQKKIQNKSEKEGENKGR